MCGVVIVLFGFRNAVSDLIFQRLVSTPGLVFGMIGILMQYKEQRMTVGFVRMLARLIGSRAQRTQGIRGIENVACLSPGQGRI